MSNSYESLGSSEKAGYMYMYIAKLEVVGLTLEDDSYSKESRKNYETVMTS